jgi:mannitol-1-phosphate/altronate dehydrogenase
LKDENETLFKWLKRQNAFKTNQTVDRIVSALIHIGRVDLAYMFKIDNLGNQCEN